MNARQRELELARLRLAVAVKTPPATIPPGEEIDGVAVNLALLKKALRDGVNWSSCQEGPEDIAAVVDWVEAQPDPVLTGEDLTAFEEMAYIAESLLIVCVMKNRSLRELEASGTKA